MRNEHLEAFETALFGILKEIDCLLEQQYGKTLLRHPARPAHGITANPQYDGLFAVIANFSAGIGSTYGAGYTLDLRISTLSSIQPEFKEACEAIMVSHLRTRLPEVFPDRTLQVAQDKHGWKIYGDLSLD